MEFDNLYFLEVSGGNKEVMLEFLQLFEEQIPEFVNAFKQAIENNDYNKVAAIAHKAISTVAIFGMKLWEQRLKEIQLEINNGNFPENINFVILEFEKDAYETLKNFKQYVNNME